MQNEQQLLDYFKKEIAREAAKERETIMEEAKTIRENALEKIRHEASVDAKNQMEREINEIILENKKEISRMQRQINQNLIAKRQELQTQIFAEVRKVLVDFTKQDEYVSFIEKNIASLPEVIYDGDVVVSISKADEALFKKVSSQFKKEVKIVSDAKVEIGGFIATNLSQGMIVDNSLDYRLENQKEWFYNHSGLVIQ